MKKEIFIVVFLGIVIGTIIAYGVYVAQNALKNQELSSRSETKIEHPEKSALETEKKDHFLTVLSPENESIQSSEYLSVSGNTSPGAVITVVSETNEYLLTADEYGVYSIDISLQGGANNITVSSFTPNGERAEETLTVVYSTAEI